MKRIINILILFLLTISLNATTYYVKVGGNDALDGQSDANAWATISKVNSSSFSAGDYILFRKGDTWRETLDMPSSGSAGNYIHYGSYGTGTNPKILGSKATTTWTDQGSNKWKSDITFTNPQALYGEADITFITTGGTKVWGGYVSGTAGLVSAYQWTWVSNYIYVYSTSNPASAYTGIEVPQRNLCIDTRYKEYVDIDGIDCFYSGWIGIDANSTHGNTENKTNLTVQNCEVGYIGGRTTAQEGYGLYTPYTNLIVRGCTIHDCGRRGIALNVYGATSAFTLTNALIEDNTFYNGYHTTALDISVGADYSNAAGWDGITFRRNLIYEPESGQPIYSNQIFLQRYNTATLQNINIYSNIFKYPSYASIMLERCNTINIHNNTFYGGSSDIVPNCHIYTNTSATAISIKNNIFYTLQSTDAGANGAAVYNIDIADAQIDDNYNLFYRTSNSLRVYSNRGTAYYMNTIAGIEPNSIASNPLFVSSADYRLQEGSPAIGEGVDLGIALDYNGYPFDADTPSIGAFELGSTGDATPVTSITVSGAGGASTISVNDGTLQLSASVLPNDATNNSVTWSISNGTGSATISSVGLVTAVSDGTVTARATANDGSGVYDDMIITISNQAGEPDPPASGGFVKSGNKFIKYNGKIVKQ
jgi:uncharacterized protein YjdB